ncbi:hypothetical protein PTTG_11650 [Puccinia triticina 1-1 BBBD Race 1]|uniref:Uncharacterized protein n=2 Tax=Puccinia triticina TaxID=208348 RepID=A0A180GXC9_PUCT1|nr:uncharacterized protein PtA15_6A260 [Puccinia triticina]OAV97008.1 hypothetical protein PTTG_11650 [Puccinia triticina 1-1 BBBD Race 1]WAQ85632.1 hypothetical protein PtA15_6A260 [Puccinia triticina]WAR55511.1 hypothetical protein PtB15_6B252 [Puccinia triticina]
MSAKNEKAHAARLRRRNDTPTGTVKTIGSGKTSVCSATGYDTAKFKGACLWNGLNQKSTPPSGRYAGWVNGAHTGNCWKNLWINAKGAQGKKFAKVIDGCKFADYLDVDTGCATLWVTEATFYELGGVEGQNEVAIKNWGFSDTAQ